MSFDFNTATPEEIRAEAERRRLRKAGYNGELPPTPEQQRRKDMLLEKDIQQRVIRLYVRNECKVYNYSQPRKAKYLTPGAADLQIFSPLGIWDDTERIKRVMWYHETKKPRDGRYSDDQLLFAANCREAGITVLGGGVEVARALLERLGLTLADGP